MSTFYPASREDMFRTLKNSFCRQVLHMDRLMRNDLRGRSCRRQSKRLSARVNDPPLSISRETGRGGVFVLRREGSYRARLP